MDEKRREFYERLLNPDVYLYPDVDWDYIIADLEEVTTLSKSRKVRYYEVPISFDIETTSFISSQLEKCACTYAWVFSINGHVILGREWWEVQEVYEKIIEIFSPNEKNRVLIYVQNLAYEFQFFCKRFEWQRVFALRERKPISCVTTENVEFRCSYMLSGFSLEKIGENLQRYKIKKMVGDLDYSLPRHHRTPLTEKEWKYIINDAQVVVAYIQETAENDGGYDKIPLTKTGYVRNYCRELCFQDRYYRKLMKVLTVDYEEYKQLKRAFAGGFTHANWHYAKQTIYDMDSYDFTSSYPYVMVAEKFPMSKARLVVPKDEEEFRYYLDKYCCLFDIEILGVDGWESPDHILSRAKCRIAENVIVNNGRIITADRVITSMTEVDFEAFERFYKYEDFRVSEFRIYEKAYLPTPFVKAILSLYKDKTELKDVEGKEVEYMKSKGMINSAYGMCVTDIVRDEDTFLDEWTKNKADIESSVEKYNNSPKRFLFYPWGVWVTAYARRNLYTGIDEFQDDYVYSDTDSVKVKNSSSHLEYLEYYNECVEEKLRAACATHRIPYEMTCPKTIKGIPKPLGVWDFDGHYTRFKTLGAKRYMTEKDGKISITVAGLNKKAAVPYIRKLAEQKGVTMFDIFDEDLYVPGEHTGKQLHTYNDNEFSSYLEDYLGTTELVHEYSSIHLAPAEYSLSLASEYIDLLKGIHSVKE